MKMTVELPDELLHRAKVLAARRRTTLKQLIVTGLDHVLRADAKCSTAQPALARLHQGLRLGGQPLTRDEVYDHR